jgi:hypothetical protein
MSLIPDGPEQDDASRSTGRATAARIGLWAGVQQLSRAEIRRGTQLPIDLRAAEGQRVRLQPSPSGECRLGMPDARTSALQLKVPLLEVSPMAGAARAPHRS